MSSRDAYAVNSAKTLADFLFDTMSYQIENGNLKKIRIYLNFYRKSPSKAAQLMWIYDFRPRL